ncbi:hypothetical protein EU528_10020 [Candidatus Thorarchaeota archaeon]|nr:MAG: hypothetical protein EU528_10020 [Candidatus Thorarchaeota archaeon]
MLHRRTLSLVFLTLLIMSGVSSFIGIGIAPSSAETTGESSPDLSGITVGIYQGYINNVDPRVNQSRLALYNMFTWMNATVFIFNTTELLNGCLWACEILAIPEGLGPTLENRLTDDGLQIIREWVALGGSYIGVRGSAAMAMNGSYFEGVTTTFDLGLVSGTSYEVEDLESMQMTNVSINRDSTGPDLSDMPANMSVLFRTGRYFVPSESQEIICIANYTHNNQPAMIAAEYGEGNLFISSPHFEYEENGDRDGTEYMDGFDDPDSEWPMLLTISRWLVDSSPTVANMSSWPYTPPAPLPMDLILIGVGVGVVLILVAVVVMKRK